jgi:hypothetical protein
VDQAVLHALSVRPQAKDRVETRVTIRTGDPRPGQMLEFTTPEGQRGLVRVESRDDAAKYSNLVLSGDVTLLKSGFFLLGTSAAA